MYGLFAGSVLNAAGLKRRGLPPARIVWRRPADERGLLVDKLWTIAGSVLVIAGSIMIGGFPGWYIAGAAALIVGAVWIWWGIRPNARRRS